MGNNFSTVAQRSDDIRETFFEKGEDDALFSKENEIIARTQEIHKKMEDEIATQRIVLQQFEGLLGDILELESEDDENETENESEKGHSPNGMEFGEELDGIDMQEFEEGWTGENEQFEDVDEEIDELEGNEGMTIGNMGGDFSFEDDAFGL